MLSVTLAVSGQGFEREKFQTGIYNRKFIKVNFKNVINTYMLSF